MKLDYVFGALCLALVLGPLIIALVNWSAWWLLLYVPVILIFGMT